MLMQIDTYNITFYMPNMLSIHIIEKSPILGGVAGFVPWGEG